MVGRGAQIGTSVQLVEFDYDPVDLVVELVTHLGPATMKVEDVLQCLDHRHIVGYAESPRAERVHALPVAAEGHAPHGQHIVCKEFEPALRCNPGIELSDRAGGSVSGRGIWFVALSHQSLVEGLELRDVHHHLAAYRE